MRAPQRSFWIATACIWILLLYLAFSGRLHSDYWDRIYQKTQERLKSSIHGSDIGKAGPGISNNGAAASKPLEVEVEGNRNGQPSIDTSSNISIVPTRKPPAANAAGKQSPQDQASKSNDGKREHPKIEKPKVTDPQAHGFKPVAPKPPNPETKDRQQPSTDTNEGSNDAPSKSRPVADQDNKSWTTIRTPDNTPTASPESKAKWPQIHVPETQTEQQASTQQASTNLAPLQKGDLVMVMASSGHGGFLGVPGLKEKVYENRKAYAETWGYDLMWANMSSYDHKSMYWNKIPIMKEALVRFPSAKWLWWLDTDVIIMNITVDMYSLLLSREGMQQQLLYRHGIPTTGGGPLGLQTPATMDPEDVNCIFTYDDWGMNTGSFLLRRGEWTDTVLDMWSDPLLRKQKWIFPEQDGWVHLYQNHDIVRRHTGIVKQTAINAYSHYNFLGKHWQQGDLLVHFPGCGGQKNFTPCHNHWDEYWEMRYPYKEFTSIREELEKGIAPIESVQKGVF